MSTWITSGLQIQEAQLNLALDIRRLGRVPNIRDDVKILQRRTKLAADISLFQVSAREWMPAQAFAGQGSDHLAQARDLTEIADEDNPVPAEVAAEDEADVLPAEKVVLALPSTLGIEDCIALGLGAVAHTELELRRAQMDDTLTRLRLGIGHKSFAFRHGVRPANSYTKRLRGWGQVATASSHLLNHARVYTAARAAAVKICPADQLAKLTDEFRELDPKRDLTARTAVLQAKQKGGKHERLAWIWTKDIKEALQDDEVMKECASPSPPHVAEGSHSLSPSLQSELAARQAPMAPMAGRARPAPSRDGLDEGILSLSCSALESMGERR